MSSRMRRCASCGRYSLEAVCPACGAATSCPVPPKYSPDDRMGKYRRMQVVENFQKRSHLRSSS